MRRAWWLVLVAAAAGFAGGCAGRASRLEARLGPADKTVRESLRSMGWIGEEGEVRQVQAHAVLTTYDEAGGAHHAHVSMDIDLAGRSLRAHSQTPQGPWKAQVREGTAGSLKADFEMSLARRERLLSALETVRICVGGPANFLFTDERVRQTERVEVQGKAWVRVAVQPNVRRTMAYYFDPHSHLLRLLTIGADRPAGEGLVARYEYMMLDDGAAFPRRITLTRTGRHVLVGSEAVVEVTFSQVRLDRADPLPLVNLLQLRSDDA